MVYIILIRMLHFTCVRREARHHGSRSLFENRTEGLEIVSLQINCSGTHVSILCRRVSIAFDWVQCSLSIIPMSVYSSHLR